MSLPPRAPSRRDSGHSTAKIAAAVISANTNHRTMSPGTLALAAPRAAIGAYITPNRGGNEQDQRRGEPLKSPCFQACKALRSPVRRLALRLGPERLGAEAHRGIDLRLAETAVGRPCMAQAVEQRRDRAVEILLQLGKGLLRHLADVKLAGELAAACDELDQRFGLRDLAGIERGIRGDFGRRPRAQQSAQPLRHRFDFRREQIGHLPPLRRHGSAPGAVDRQGNLAAQPAHGVVDGLERGAHRHAAAKIAAQLADHPLQLRDRDRHRDAVARLGDARGDRGAGRLDAEADDLPRRRKPAHHHQQRIKKQRVVLRRGGFDQLFAFVKLVTGEVRNAHREFRGKLAERRAIVQHASQRFDVIARRVWCRSAPACDGCLFRLHLRLRLR